jgi:hypothetical protein
LDVNRWQPLDLPGAVDQNGNPIPAIQRFQSPEWGRVIPFALKPADKDTFNRSGFDWYVYHDPGPPPMLDTSTNGDPSEFFRWNYSMVVSWTGHLDPTDGVMWDISPAGIGNNQEPYPQTMAEYESYYDFTNGGMPGATGHDINPATGQPYAPQVVPRADYTRVLAQFWADGPSSETPPGHWFAIFNKAMSHPAFVKRFNGKGPVLPDLEYDVKAYMILGGAVHDAAISAWSIKGWYDNGRPVTNLRFMATKGQSSDPAKPNYNPAGVKLIPGLIEQIEANDPLAGATGQHIGKIKFNTWLGPLAINNPMTDIAGVGWILAESWWPFQRKTFVTPPFAGYVSGHSTYSRAAAEALTLITGDAFFPGGMAEYHVPANSNFLGVEKGPSVDVTLQWATYRDASDQTSLSRIWGSIHPPIDDIPGRIIGEKCGKGSYYLAKDLFYNDNDSDGFYSYEDCNDDNPAIYPGAADICDGLDNDCNGQVDENLTINTYFSDQDQDGFGDFAHALNTCLTEAPSGFVVNSMDCDDNNAAIYPGALEVCDSLDNDCSGIADDGLTFYTFYIDTDGDTYGNAASSFSTCIEQLPTGYADNGLDCDDNNAAIHPGAFELCDSIDNNCSGVADEGLEFFTYFQDLDGDQFGDAAHVFSSCLTATPLGYSNVGGDCDDNNPEVYPNAPELCDDLDNNCDGVVDDGLTMYSYYTDGDGDGYGVLASLFESCLFPTPIGFATNGLDCDDDNPEVNPDKDEIFGDNIDNNCDGLVDSISSVKDLSLHALAYPNPVRETMTIEVDFDGAMDYELSSIGGQLMKKGTVVFSGNAASISFAQHQPGVYMLRMFDPIGHHLIQLRVIKM